MKIPSKIKVAGHTYKVIQHYKFKERNDVYGQCRHEQQEIRLAGVDVSGTKLSSTRIEDIFIHEVLHAIDYYYNAHKLDEDTVERLSSGLYQVLKDNKIM